MIFLLLLLTLCTGSALAQNFGTSGDKVYTAVEQMPQFPGGDSKLMKYISENIKYPETDECVDGQVIVQFVVTKTGEVGDVKVVRHLHPMFDEEARNSYRDVRTVFRSMYGTYCLFVSARSAVCRRACRQLTAS